jgi:hypothetical protein
MSPEPSLRSRCDQEGVLHATYDADADAVYAPYLAWANVAARPLLCSMTQAAGPRGAIGR